MSQVRTYPKEEDEEEKGGPVHDQDLFESESRGTRRPNLGPIFIQAKGLVKTQVHVTSAHFFNSCTLTQPP